jgi:hypothetical protein
MRELKYSYESLQKFCNENELELIGDYNTKLSYKSIISGKCKYYECFNDFKKSFFSLITYGGYCKKCMSKIRCQKIKNTCLQKYGVENPFQNESIKQKIKISNIDKYGAETYSGSELGKIHIKQTVKDKYGVDNVSKLVSVKQKKQQTSYNNFGVYCHLQDISIKEKIKSTNNNKYGVNYGFQSDIIKEKIKKTCMRKYGVEFIGQSSQQKYKKKITNINKYGVENPTQNQDIKTKIINTCIQRYGVSNPTQNSEIAEKAVKNSYQTKQYVFPSGKHIFIQGYEHLALDELINKEYISENDIVTGTKNVPTIWYTTEDGIKHRHYVDIFIPTQNRCIEVKSTWTINLTQSNIFLKQNAAKNLGYKYEIWVYNKKREKISCYN